MTGADATWVAVAMSAVAMLGTVANGVLGWLGNRDKLRLDRDGAVKALSLENAAKTAVLEARVEHLTEDLAECKEQHAESRKDKDELKQEVTALRARVDRKIGALTAEVRDLHPTPAEGAVRTVDDGTGEMPPLPPNQPGP